MSGRISVYFTPFTVTHGIQIGACTHTYTETQRRINAAPRDLWRPSGHIFFGINKHTVIDTRYSINLIVKKYKYLIPDLPDDFYKFTSFAFEIIGHVVMTTEQTLNRTNEENCIFIGTDGTYHDAADYADYV